MNLPERWLKIVEESVTYLIPKIKRCLVALFNKLAKSIFYEQRKVNCHRNFLILLKFMYK